MENPPRKHTKRMVNDALVSYFNVFRRGSTPVGGEMKALSYQQLEFFFKSSKYVAALENALNAVVHYSSLSNVEISTHDAVCFSLSQLLIHRTPRDPLALFAKEDTLFEAASEDASRSFCAVAAMILTSYSLPAICVERVDGFVIKLLFFLHEYEEAKKRDFKRRVLFMKTVLMAVYKLFRKKGAAWKGRPAAQRLMERCENGLEAACGIETLRSLQVEFLGTTFVMELRQRNGK